MRKSVILTAAFLATSVLGFSQDYARQFHSAFLKEDTGAQVKVLHAWMAASPKDPELFVAYFNYYVQRSRSEEISLDGQRTGGSSFAVRDTGTGKQVAYLNASVTYNSELLQKGFDYINQGIALHPARLDMRFGKIHMLGEAANYPAFAQEIIATIEAGQRMGNAWLWKEGKPLEQPREFFLGSLQDYITQIYNTEDNTLLPLMRQVSETVVKYYPDHVESLANIALTYLVAGDYDKALPYLLRAETIAPKDVIVLNNIAEAYKRKGDKENARRYYEKVIRYGNDEEKQDASAKMKGL